MHRIVGFMVIAIAIAVVTLTTASPATAYLVFTDRDSWLMAVSGFPQSVEDFNGIPDGQYAFGTLPSTVFTNLDPVQPAFQPPAEISAGIFGPASGNPPIVVWMGFSNPVVGVGLDIVNPDRVSFQYGISEIPFSTTLDGGAFNFQEGFLTEPRPEFVGWVAEPGDAALRQTFVFFDWGGDQPVFGFDNLRVAEIPIPGAFPLFVCALAALAAVGYGKLQNRV